MYFQRRRHTTAQVLTMCLSFSSTLITRAFMMSKNYMLRRPISGIWSSRRSVPQHGNNMKSDNAPVFMYMSNGSNSRSISKRNGNGSNSNSNSRLDISSIFGGDYAGQSATFSNLDGSLIRVPERYVPESLIEWGQIPGCLEVIVSEDLKMTNEEEQEGEETLTRTAVTVLPEVGCGIDNLETMKKKEEIALGGYKAFAMDRYQIATCLIPNTTTTKKHRVVECIFLFRDNDHDKKATTYRTRIRIFLKDGHGNEFHPSMPMEVIQERKTSEKSTTGRIADGGGLDARTVMQLVGKDKINQPFCEEKVPTSPGIIASMMNGTWQKTVQEGAGVENKEKGIDADNNENVITYGNYNHEYWNSHHDGENENVIFTKTANTTTTTFILPGNILVRKCNKGTQQTLEVGLVEMNQQLVSHRVVIQYNFQHDDDNDGNDNPMVQCFMERKLTKDMKQ